MNYLLNIYEFGLITKTEIHTNEKSALKAFQNHFETLEGDFEKGVTFCSCTPTFEESNTPALVPDEVKVFDELEYTDAIPPEPNN
jgi:hypothetical protein